MQFLKTRFKLGLSPTGQKMLSPRELEAQVKAFSTIAHPLTKVFCDPTDHTRRCWDL